MKKRLVLNKDLIDDTFSELCKREKYEDYLVDKSYYKDPQGVGIYRLLAYIADELVDLFGPCDKWDVGTNQGTSAVILSSMFSGSGWVHTFDIVDNIRDDNIKYMMNRNRDIKIRIKNLLDDPEYLCDNLRKYNIPFIFLDIDPHLGEDERKFVEMLDKCGFSGILLLDDTRKDGLSSFWSELMVRTDVKTYDVTKYGHWTGSGLVVFDKDLEVILE